MSPAIPLPPTDARATSVPWARPAGLSARYQSFLPSLSRVLRTVSRPQAWADLLLTIGILFFSLIGTQLTMVLICTLKTGAAPPENWQPPKYLLLVDKAVAASAAIGTLYLFCTLWRVRAAEFGVRREQLGKQVLFSFPTLIGCYIALFAVGIPVMIFAYESGQDQSEAQRRMEFMSEMEFPSLWMTIVTMLLVATHEEIMFRGVAIPILRRLGTPAWAAILATSIVFGSLHFLQGWTAALQLVGVGVVLGAAYLLSRSILTVIVAHATFNVLGTILAKYLAPWMTNPPSSAPASQPVEGLLLLIRGLF